MTENDLRVELLCYREYVNPDCDINNMTKDELEEFYELYVKSETYFKSIHISSAAKVMEDQRKFILSDENNFLEI